LGNRLRFLFKRLSLQYGRLDLSRYQLIGAYLAALEGMRIAEQHLEYSRQASDVINRQDQKRLCTELPANSRFNPGIRLGILDAENLAASVDVSRDSE
jgi:hypothetical protein